MSAWTIYYSDGQVSGASLEEWELAPSQDVQFVIVHQPWDYTDVLPDRFETGFVVGRRRDVQCFTGVDVFDPLNYGVPKYGRLLSDDDYARISERAYG